MIDPAADNRAVGKFRPIAGPNDTRIARSHVKKAIWIGAKRIIPCVRVHEAANTPRAFKGVENNVSPMKAPIASRNTAQAICEIGSFIGNPRSEWLEGVQ
jgi:hypothetical protein